MRVGVPTQLSDAELIDGLSRCARDERAATATLVAHLAEMDARELHLALGFSSLFAYCLEVLRFSESATCKRIDVARAARRHPVILDHLVDGSLSLTTARLIAPHLTEDNRMDLIAAAAGRGMRAVEELIARRFPRPDVGTVIRKLPVPAQPLSAQQPLPASCAQAAALAPIVADTAAVAIVPLARPSPASPLIAPTSADRYQIRFTASGSTCKKLRLAQDLLRHAVPSGDVAEIVDRALTALIDDIARKKCAATTNAPRRGRSPSAGSRHVPSGVRRAVWKRDEGMCAFVGSTGRRCRSRAFLEFHHLRPYAVGGAPTLSNIELRCRAHNLHEAKLFFGPTRGRDNEGRKETEH